MGVVEFNREKSSIVGYSKIFKKIAGNMATAMVLSQLEYWALVQEKRGMKEFYKTDRELMFELDITENQLRLAKKKIKELGIFKVEVRGLPPKTYYTLNEEIYINLMDSYSENHGNYSVKTTETISLKQRNSFSGFNDNINITKNTTLNTTITTTENTNARARDELVSDDSKLILAKRKEHKELMATGTHGIETAMGARGIAELDNSFTIISKNETLTQQCEKHCEANTSEIITSNISCNVATSTVSSTSKPATSSLQEHKTQSVIQHNKPATLKRSIIKKPTFNYEGFSDDECRAIDDWLKCERTAKKKRTETGMTRLRNQCLDLKEMGRLIEGIEYTIEHNTTRGNKKWALPYPSPILDSEREAKMFNLSRIEKILHEHFDGQFTEIEVQAIQCGLVNKNKTNKQMYNLISDLRCKAESGDDIVTFMNNQSQHTREIDLAGIRRYTSYPSLSGVTFGYKDIDAIRKDRIKRLQQSTKLIAE